MEALCVKVGASAPAAADTQQHTGPRVVEMKVTWPLWVSERCRAEPPNCGWMSWMRSSILYSFHSPKALTVGTLHSSQWPNALKLSLFFSHANHLSLSWVWHHVKRKTHTCTYSYSIEKKNTNINLFVTFFFNLLELFPKLLCEFSYFSRSLSHHYANNKKGSIWFSNVAWSLTKKFPLH